MTSLARSDIFFIITGVAVVALSLIFLVILIYVAYIMKELHHIMRVVHRESELISEDIAELRTKVATQGFKWSSIFIFLRKLWRFKSSKKKRDDF
ncbi:MAG: hypothetical protein WC764_02745 [Candidatus Paceibacterota bacterium]|jgi:Na+-transporting methylmalonyl-CoA/oxaloacetate decarboxylase gamma subunit